MNPPRRPPPARAVAIAAPLDARPAWLSLAAAAAAALAVATALLA